MTRKQLLTATATLCIAATAAFALVNQLSPGSQPENPIAVNTTVDNHNHPDVVPKGQTTASAVQVSVKTPAKSYKTVLAPRAIPDYVDKGLAWLAQHQLPNGAWPAHPGSTASYMTDEVRYQEDIRENSYPETTEKRSKKSNATSGRQPLDPASTALAATAFLRAGHTLTEGKYSANVHKALDFLLKTVDETPVKSTNIGAYTGTQPQNKLGQNIDLAMTTQFLTRLLAIHQNDSQIDAQKLRAVRSALEKCVQMLQNSQQKDGSWTGSGWAPVLNSAMANNALEFAQAQGITVDAVVLERSQAYQRDNVSEDGSVRTESAAGVELYALSSSKRANVQESKKAEKYLDAPASAYQDKDAAAIEKEMKRKGAKDDEARRMAQAVTSYNAASKNLQNDVVLQGFGNNGGEEFLSYMMNSEACVAEGQKPWDQWHTKMANLFGKIQNPDGSWSGHHCITTNVFCTAAVIMTLTADRDPIML
jgi:hypothetical protein